MEIFRLRTVGHVDFRVCVARREGKNT